MVNLPFSQIREMGVKCEPLNEILKSFKFLELSPKSGSVIGRHFLLKLGV